MSMNFNGSKPTPDPVAEPKKNNNKTIAGIVITASLVIVATIGALYLAGEMNNVVSQFSGSDKSSVSSDIISGEYDTLLRQKCIERLNSYGLGTVTEGSINLCVDTAKAIAYHELNK